MTESGSTPAEVVCALLPAIAAGRVAEVLALVDPHVVCITGTRPALTRYEGHAGMARLVTDLRAVYGRYRVDATEDTDSLGDSVAAVGAGTRVVVRMAGTRETEDGEVSIGSALVVATVRAGLVTFLETVPKN